MGDETTEAHVLRFVADKTNVRLEKVSLVARLGHDLGVDGDDAVELFEAYEKEFHVDLRLLWETWSEHFGPEASFFVSPPFLVACVAIGTSIIFLQIISGISLPSWSIVVVAIVGGFFVALGYVRVYRTPLKEITVADLVNAARRGAWPDTQTHPELRG